MTKQKSTKRALLLSALSLLMCVSMLIGSTFAWFTDSVTSKGNIIKSGTLDVTMEWADGTKAVPADDSADWIDASKGAIFNYKLWEPGYTEVRHIKIANEGTLALKYQLNILANGEVSELADVIDVYYVDPAQQVADRTALKEENKLGTLSDVLANINTTASGNLKADEKVTLTLALKMQESAGNKYQDMEIGSDFSIQLLATQLTSEFDSFDDQYDADSTFVAEVKDASELALALANNESVVLANDIELTGEWTPIGDKDAGIYYSGTLDGNGHTISGLTVSNGDYVALISAAKDATIKNLTVEGTVSGKNAAGIVARVEGNTVIENCVNNATVAGTSKAGGIACNVTGADAKIIGCTNNGDITWSNESNGGVGGIVGYVNNNANLEIINCTNTGDVTSLGKTYAGAAVGYAAQYSTGRVIGMTNSGVITGSVIADGRYLEYDGTVLCGFVGTVGNWSAGVIVDDTAELIEKIKTAPIGTESIIYLADGTYDGNIDITIAALGAAGGDIVIKAFDGAEPVIAGTVTIGYRQQNVGAASYNAKITFDGITFDHAEAGNHCLNVQDVESFYMVNCTVIGDGEYGLSTPGNNGTGAAKIEKCKFINAGLQLYGQFSKNLVIDFCEFDESVINVGAGGDNGPEIINSKFKMTLTDAHNNNSFYVIRNSTTGADVTVTNCDITVDSTMTVKGVAGSKGWGVFVDRNGNNFEMTISNVRITMTDAALAQEALGVATCQNTGKINMTNVTLNGDTVQQ